MTLRESDSESEVEEVECALYRQAEESAKVGTVTMGLQLNSKW